MSGRRVMTVEADAAVAACAHGERRRRFLQYASLAGRRARTGAGKVRVEAVSSGRQACSVFTASDEDVDGPGARSTDRTMVSRVPGDLVAGGDGSIVERDLGAASLYRRVDLTVCDGLASTSSATGRVHHYLTIVVDHDRQRVRRWAGKGRARRRSDRPFGSTGWVGPAATTAPTGDGRLGEGCELAESAAGAGPARAGGLRPLPRGKPRFGGSGRSPAGGATGSGREDGQDAQGVALLPAEAPEAAQAGREAAAGRGALRLPRSRGQVKAFGSRHGVYININSCGRCGSRAQRGVQRTCGRP